MNLGINDRGFRLNSQNIDHMQLELGLEYFEPYENFSFMSPLIILNI